MMETTINWSVLYQNGRCRDIGVAWSDEELKARMSGIPAEYVRLGILTQAQYLAKKDEIDKAKDPLMLKNKEELLVLAHKEGINATSSASKETLIQLLGGDKVSASAVKKQEEVLAGIAEEPEEKPKSKKGKKNDK